MKFKFHFLLTLIVSVLVFQICYSETTVIAPKVNHRVEPVGIENNKPVFRWNLDDTVRNTFQKSYRLMVASDPELLGKNPDVWDSGWIDSGNCVETEYAGKKLNPSQKYYWKVQVRNNRDEISQLKQPATFVTGIFEANQWKAKWISMNRQNSDPLPIFRKSFNVSKNTKTVKTALVHICGLGHYELRLNGNKVGQSFIDPGWTNYRKTCLYSSYDITSMIHDGENVFGVLLGNGMYNVPGGRYVKFKGSFGLPQLIAQLEILYADGTMETIITDNSWRCAFGPITFSCVYGGEDFDATRLENGWDLPGFNDTENTRWQSAILTDSPGGILRAQEAPPIVIAETLKPVSVKRLDNGQYLADFGYNFSGRPRILLRGSAGSKVTVKTGELSNRIWQGHSYTYTLAGNGQNLPLENNAFDLSYNNLPADKNLELILPKFSYFGFQYLQIEGVVRSEDRTDTDRDLPTLVDICADFTTSASEKAGAFHCSNEMFNEIDAMIDRSVRSNLQSVLTDCPHREKLGWLEVAHLMSLSIMSRYDIQNLYRKICRDTAESQLDNGLIPDIAPEYTRFKSGFFESPEWGSAAVLLPYQLANIYGDREILTRQRETMKRYIDYLASVRNKQGLVKAGLGDWYDWTPAKGHAGYSQLTPRELTATAMLYLNSVIYAQITPDSDEKQKYMELAGRVKEDYIKSYEKPDGTIAAGSQAALALSIPLKLYSNDKSNTDIFVHLLKRLEQDHYAPTTGEVTFRYLLESLSEGDRDDIIWTILSRTEKPGYGYMLKKLNMKTLSERWDRLGESMNHCMFGHAQEWFSQRVIGIRFPQTSDIFSSKKPLPCCYEIAPKPVGDLTSAEGYWNSPFGKIESAWKIEANRFKCRIKIPANLTCNISLPTTGTSDEITLDQIPLKQHKIDVLNVTTNSHNKINTIEIQLGSGVYNFETKW
jgi:hypothetical protein